MKENNDVEILKNYKDVLTLKEVQNILKIGRNKTYELLRNGTIKSIRIEKQYRIPKINVIKYLQNQQ